MEPKSQSGDASVEGQIDVQAQHDQWVQDKESLLSFYDLHASEEAKLDMPLDTNSSGTAPGVPGDILDSGEDSFENLGAMISNPDFWIEIAIMEREVMFRILHCAVTNSTMNDNLNALSAYIPKSERKRFGCYRAILIS